MDQLSFRKVIFVVVLAAFGFALIACGSSVTGTYSGANGLIMVELRSGGKATASMMGQSSECTYTVDGKQVNLDCNGDKTPFRVNDDGSLTGPGFMGVLQKSRK